MGWDGKRFPSLKGFDLAADYWIGFSSSPLQEFPSLKGFDLAADPRLFPRPRNDVESFHPSKGSTSQLTFYDDNSITPISGFHPSKGSTSQLTTRNLNT